MYSHCLFCSRRLERNDALETFPVGRRIAFDGARGRLWVVCRVCERWNLVPLEERWEVVEECERLFGGLLRRASTDQIGLARHPAGVDLVRIGEPLRPEFAAWRYGDQFGRRRRRMLAWGGVGAVLLGGLVVGSYLAGVGFGAIYTVTRLEHHWSRYRPRARVPVSPHRIVPFRDVDLARAELRGHDGEIELRLRHSEESWTFTGGEARRLAVQVLPSINRGGGTAAQVRDAVSAIEDAGHPERFLAVARGPNPVGRLSVPRRLAIEMALHEEEERRALAGELSGLRAMWKQAEELAAISDDLLSPPGALEFIRQQRDDTSGERPRMDGASGR